MPRTDLLDIFYDPLKEADVVEALKSAIIDNENEVLDLNRDQLDKGLDSEGYSLGEYANFKYKGRWEPVDLKLTGEYRDAFVLKIDRAGSDIASLDPKSAKLKKRYGKQIEGIPLMMIDEMQEIVREDFVNQYRKQVLK